MLMGVPRYLYLTITRECNLRCQQCHFWTYKDPIDRLSISEYLNVIDQFYEINPEGIVVINGGEPTIHREEFFEITNYIKRLNMRSACVTNGYNFEDDICRRMIKEGPTYLTISLDSHIPEIHNRLRGREDAFDKTISTIKRLVYYLNGQNASTLELTVTTIIFDENIKYLPQYIEFIRGIGVRGVLFQIINPTFARISKEDKFFNEHFFKNKSEAITHIKMVYEKYKNDSFVFLSESEVNWICSYIENPDFLSEPVCDSHNKNIFLELTGDIVLCAHMRNFNNGAAIGNIREKRLKDILNSDIAQKMRGIMERCRKNCGLLACHKKDT
ncbi:MAG: radical SAM protein [Myxococcota bacterium]